MVRLTSHPRRERRMTNSSVLITRCLFVGHLAFFGLLVRDSVLLRRTHGVWFDIGLAPWCRGRRVVRAPSLGTRIISVRIRYPLLRQPGSHQVTAS